KTRQSSAAVSVTSTFFGPVLSFEGANRDRVIWLPATFLMSAVNSSAWAAPRLRKRRVESGAAFRMGWSIWLGRKAQELLTLSYARLPCNASAIAAWGARERWGSDAKVRLYELGQPRGAIELCRIPRRASVTSTAVCRTGARTVCLSSGADAHDMRRVYRSAAACHRVPSRSWRLSLCGPLGECSAAGRRRSFVRSPAGRWAPRRRKPRRNPLAGEAWKSRTG